MTPLSKTRQRSENTNIPMRQKFHETDENRYREIPQDIKDLIRETNEAKRTVQSPRTHKQRHIDRKLRDGVRYALKQHFHRVESTRIIVLEI